MEAKELARIGLADAFAGMIPENSHDRLRVRTRDAVHQGAGVGDERQHPHRPIPDPATGELKIDPEILLKSKKIDLAVSFYYSSVSNADDEYGRSRSASVRGHILSSV